MKHLYIIWITACSFLFLNTVLGQQRPVFTSHIYNPEYYNPALLDSGYVAIIHNNQWFKLKNQAPKAFALFTDLSPFVAGLSERIGIGLSLQSDITIFNRTNADFHFAYHFIKEQSHRFSMGVVAGVLSQRIDITDKSTNEPNDPIFNFLSFNDFAFNGGLGLAYRYEGTNKNTFSFDLALPQFFANEPDTSVFNNRFHVLSGLRYRANLSKITIEPSLLYRGVNGEESQIPLHVLETSTRVFFLGNRFWLGGGMRINGLTYHAGFGVEITENIDLQLNYSNHHNEFGGTYGFTIKHDIGRLKKPNPDPLINSDAKTLTDKYEKEKRAKLEAKRKEIIDELKRIDDDLTSLTNTETDNSQIIRQLDFASNAYEQANYKGLSKEAITNKLIEADNYLAKAKIELEKSLDNAQIADSEIWASTRVLKEAEKYEMKVRNFSTKEVEQKLIEPVLEDNQRYIELNRLIQQMRYENDISSSLSMIIAQKNTDILEGKLQSDLSKVAGIEFRSKVEVQQAEHLAIRYSFPYTENAYTIGTTDTRTLILDHIKYTIQELEDEGVEIASLGINLLLRDEMSDVRDKTKPTEYPYLGEFGISPVIEHIRFDNDLNQTRSLSTEIQEGQPTSLYDLACLKLYGVNEYMENDSSRTIKISAPHEDNRYSQTCEIRITIAR